MRNRLAVNCVRCSTEIPVIRHFLTFLPVDVRGEEEATKKAMKPIRMFWIIFTSTAACSPSLPSTLPATVTAPVESTMPPMSAPPIRADMPVALMISGSKTIIRIVKMMEMEMVIAKSVFLQPDAAPEAMAVDVPQTFVAEAMVMTSG